MGEEVNIRSGLGALRPAGIADALAEILDGYLSGRITGEECGARLARLPEAAPLTEPVTFTGQRVRGRVVVGPAADGARTAVAPGVTNTIQTHGSELRDISQFAFQNCTILLQARHPADVPTAPMPRAPRLIGRDAVRDTVIARLLAPDGPVVTACWGAPCTGKTDLVRAVGWDIRVRAHFPGGVLYAELGGVGRDTDVLTGWCRQLGLSLDGEVPIKQAAELIRTRLSTSPALLVVDDVWPQDQHVTALVLSCVPPGSRVLLSSRSRDTAGEYTTDGLLEVPPVDIEARLEILRLHASSVVDAEPEACAALAASLGGLAGAVSFAGRLLARAQGSGHPAQDLLNTWRDRLRELRGLTAHPALDNSGSASLEALISLGYDRLPSAVRARAAELAVFGPVPLDFDFAALCAVWGRPHRRRFGMPLRNGSADDRDRAFPEPVPLPAETATAWGRAVVDNGLVEYDARHRRYRIHEVVHAYLLARRPPAAAYERHAAHYESLLRDNAPACRTEGGRAAQAVARLDSGYGQLKQVAQRAARRWDSSLRWRGILLDLPDLAADYCAWRRRYADLADWTRSAVEAAESSGAPGEQRMILYEWLAKSAAKIGRPREALDCVDRMMELDPDRLSDTELRYQRALLRRMAGDPADVGEAYEAYLDEVRLIYPAISLITHLGNYANYHRDSGRREKAADVLAEAVELARSIDLAELSLEDADTVLRICVGYADDCEALGRPEEAQEVRDFARSAFPDHHDGIVQAEAVTDRWVAAENEEPGAIVTRGGLAELLQWAEVARRYETPAIEVRALTGIAGSLLHCGREREALPHTERVLELLDSPAAAQAYDEVYRAGARALVLGIRAKALCALRLDHAEYRRTLRDWAEQAARAGDMNTVVEARSTLVLLDYERGDQTAARSEWERTQTAAEAEGPPEERDRRLSCTAWLAALLAVDRGDLAYCADRLDLAERLAEPDSPFLGTFFVLRICLLGFDGRRDEALRVLEEMLARTDEQAHGLGHRALALAHFGVGDEEAAARSLRRARELHERDAEAATALKEQAGLEVLKVRVELLFLEQERANRDARARSLAAELLEELRATLGRLRWSDERAEERPWYDTVAWPSSHATLVGALMAMAGDVPAGERILREQLAVTARNGQALEHVEALIRLGWLLHHAGRAAEVAPLLHRRLAQVDPVTRAQRRLVDELLAHCTPTTPTASTPPTAAEETAMNDSGTTAAALATRAVAALAPDLPELHARTAVANGLPSARVWQWLTGRYGHDAVLSRSFDLLVLDTGSRPAAEACAARLAHLLTGDDQGRAHLAGMLTKDVVQSVTATRHSRAEDITMRADGDSELTVTADDNSVVKGVRMEARRKK